jgi:hypothetical protein
MLENYKIDENGVIHQINYKPFDYSMEYNNKYNKYGENVKRMSYLRLGYLIGSIGYIPKSILDIGVGNGDFIKCASSLVKECYINDITKIDIENTTWTDDLNIKVDVITMFDVLEHFENMDIISNFNCNYLILSVPNCEYGYDDDWFINWKHRRPEEHFHHFNKDSLKKYVESMGYSMINITNIEDIIRKYDYVDVNILTSTFKKNYE